MAAYILFLLTVCIGLSFLLAAYSIHEQYMGALACWTVCFTPLGIGLDIVLAAVVNKSKAENTGADGEGIRYRQILNQEDTPTI